MLKIKCVVVGQPRTNCYLVFDQKTKEAIVIDPGDDADYLIRIIFDEDINPTKIVATHGHFDHILGVTELKLAFNIPFLMHRNDEFLLERMQQSAKHFSGVKTDPAPTIDKYLRGGKKLRVGNSELEIIHTPGHTPGSLAFYNSNLRACFVGDLVFAQGIGRTDFTYSSSNDLKKSIEKISDLPSETKLFSGHGKPVSVKDIVNRS
jgi:hydroxyacylglutathione hydrolase